MIPVTRLSKWNFYLSKNQEFTDIDSNENINLLQNKISYISILFKNHQILLYSHLKMHFCAVEVS